MRRRIISYLDALFIGMILGLLFVTLVHASPVPQPRELHTQQLKVFCNHIRQFQLQ